MSFWKLFSLKKKKGLRATYPKFDRFLEKHPLIGADGKALVYDDLLEHFFPKVDQDEMPAEYHFRENFDSIVTAQQTCFQAMVDAKLSPDTTEAFFANYHKTAQATYPMPSTNRFFVSFWHQIIPKAKDQMLAKPQLFDADRVERFAENFEEATRKYFPPRPPLPGSQSS